MRTVIKVEKLSKRYLLSHKPKVRYLTLREALTNNAKAVGQRLRRPFSSGPELSGGAAPTEEFWALKDVSFEVKQGERIGIVGHNGAGKSTLLKILSRITEPTGGRVSLKGRVASLLEIGTGFHPELTGRENIFLNGAILGMSRVEILTKFDEIVAFAEVEKFLDTPVKRYSSGMYVRLAFAVAAHLEPEILIVDEVLAVGDAQFQKKCLGKMEEVGKGGRTVLFVSHQMAAIQKLCGRAVVLKNGGVKFIGDTQTAIGMYLGELEMTSKVADLSRYARSGSGLVKLTSFALENASGEPVSAIKSGDLLVFAFGYECTEEAEHKNVSIGFSIHNSLGDRLVVFYSHYMGVTFNLISNGLIKCVINDFPFSTGRYFVSVRILVNGEESDWLKSYVGTIDVESGNFYGSGSFGDFWPRSSAFEGAMDLSAGTGFLDNVLGHILKGYLF